MEGMKEIAEAKYPSRGITVDEDAGVVRNVVVLGQKSPSRNRTYTTEAMKGAVQRGMFEGVPYFVGQGDDHRDYKTLTPVDKMVGVLRNPQFNEAEGKIRADVDLLEKHRDWFMDLAQKVVESGAEIGNSPKMLGRMAEDSGAEQVVNSIARVKQVDLVQTPGTVKTLAEAEKGGQDMDPSELDVDTLEDVRPDLVREIQEAAAPDQGDGSGDAEKLKQELDEARDKIDELEAEKAVRERRELVEKKLAESDLPERYQTDRLRKRLIEAKDEEAIDALIQDRTEVLQKAADKPQSVEKQVAEAEGEDAPDLDQVGEIITG